MEYLGERYSTEITQRVILRHITTPDHTADTGEMQYAAQIHVKNNNQRMKHTKDLQFNIDDNGINAVTQIG